MLEGCRSVNSIDTSAQFGLAEALPLRAALVGPLQFRIFCGPVIP